MVDKGPMKRIDPRTAAGQKVKWDDSAMSTSYANVCNVTSTREEVTLLFGTHQNWQTGQDEVTVRLSDRIILSPFAAKRLALLITGLVGEYEKRFGPVIVERKAESDVH
jgi:hypothetical protein